MILRLFFFVPFAIIPCNLLIRDQSVIPMFDNSKNKLFYPTLTSIYTKNVNVEEWDSITLPPYKVIGSVIRAPNTMHEIEEKIPAMKEGDMMYNNDNDKLNMHRMVEKRKESDSTSISKHDEINNNFSRNEVNSNNETSAEKSIIRRNCSSCHFLSPNSTVTVSLGSTISTSNIVNDTFMKIQMNLIMRSLC